MWRGQEGCFWVDQGGKGAYTDANSPGGAMGILRTILILIVVAIVIGFSIYNAEPRVDVDLIRWQYNVPLVVVVYWSFLAGMVASLILGFTYILKLQSDRRSERRDKRRLESELASLRNRTIGDLDEL
jgi:uncharacterized integral membrane protein